MIRQAISHLAATGQTFSSNDVRLLLPKVAPQLIGATFLKASRRGEIKAVGWTAAGHAEAHGRPVRLWKGTRRPPVNAPLCGSCGTPMNAKLAELGWTAHPMCAGEAER